MSGWQIMIPEYAYWNQSVIHTQEPCWLRYDVLGWNRKGGQGKVFVRVRLAFFQAFRDVALEVRFTRCEICDIEEAIDSGPVIR